MAGLTAFQKFMQCALKYGFSVFGIPKTGQVTVYIAGDDGTYQKGYQKIGTRFTDNGDGTVTDNATGLMWVADPSVLGEAWGSEGSPLATNIETAISNCEALDYAGHTDWRLPNVKELISIVRYEPPAPVIDTDYFSNIQQANYWTSTTNPANVATVYQISFASGAAAATTHAQNRYVLPVRGG